MASSTERLAVVETKVAVIERVTSETSGDVKLLLAWRDEERGAREAERLYRDEREARFGGRVKIIGITLSLLTIAINVLFRVVG